MDNERYSIKITKKATQKSIMDVTSNLEYWVTNSKLEEVYKGSIIFSITEMEPRNYGKAWVGKEKAKMLMHAIINLNFEGIFGPDGFTDYGGTKDGKVIRSRVLNVKMSPKKQLIFTISEGAGKLGSNGNIEMIGKAEKIVKTFVSFQDSLQMAHEIYDFIRDFELNAMFNDKPLYTLMPKPDSDKKSEEESKTKSEYNKKIKMMNEKLKKMEIKDLKELFEKIKDSKEEKNKQLKTLIESELKVRKSK